MFVSSSMRMTAVPASLTMWLKRKEMAVGWRESGRMDFILAIEVAMRFNGYDFMVIVLVLLV